MEDLTQSLIDDVFNEYVKGLEKDGFTNEQIEQRLEEAISDGRISHAAEEIISRVTEHSVDYFKSNMYDRVLYERAEAARFMAHNEQIWGKGFIVSEAMYAFILDMAKDFNAYVWELPQSRVLPCQFRLLSLREIHGRACQQFLEILYLLKAGFADGAYARWRSLYELSVIAQFIVQTGEGVAKAYFEARESDDRFQQWPKALPLFSKYKQGVPFSKIQDYCNLPKEWKAQYELACKITHASPQGTFARLSNGPTAQNMIPVGHSDYGLAMPAVDSAIALAKISMWFFATVVYGDSLVYIQSIGKYMEILRDCYAEIHESCFPKSEKPDDSDNSEDS